MKRDQPSSTAQLIARGIVFVAHDKRWKHLVWPRAAGLSAGFLQAASRRARLLLRLLRCPWFRALVWRVESLALPGILLHYAARKRYLEDAARQALQDGIQQIVVLGAGFDTLAWRLHDECEVVFIEADHAATQRIKRRCQSLAFPRLHFLEIDFSRQSLAKRLEDCPHYSPAHRTLFIAEGLLMYLKPSQVADMFEEVAAPHNRFAFTFMEIQRDGRPNFRHCNALVGLWLRWRGEPFRWGLRRDELAPFLQARGWELRETADAEVLRRRYLQGQKPLAEGERIAIADCLPPKPGCEYH